MFPYWGSAPVHIATSVMEFRWHWRCQDDLPLFTGYHPRGLFLFPRSKSELAGFSLSQESFFLMGWDCSIVHFHCPKVNLYCSMVNLQNTSGSLHISRKSSHGSRVSLYGYRRSLYDSKMSLYGSKMSICCLWWASATQNEPPRFQGELPCLPDEPYQLTCESSQLTVKTLRFRVSFHTSKASTISHSSSRMRLHSSRVSLHDLGSELPHLQVKPSQLQDIMQTLWQWWLSLEGVEAHPWAEEAHPGAVGLTVKQIWYAKSCFLSVESSCRKLFMNMDNFRQEIPDHLIATIHRYIFSLSIRPGGGGGGVEQAPASKLFTWRHTVFKLRQDSLLREKRRMSIIGTVSWDFLPSGFSLMNIFQACWWYPRMVLIFWKIR